MLNHQATAVMTDHEIIYIQAVLMQMPDGRVPRVREFFMEWYGVYLSQCRQEREARRLQAELRNRQNPLLRLPAELRNAIYDLVTPAQIRDWDEKIEARRFCRGHGWRRLPHHLRLIGVSQQIRRECKPFAESLIQIEIYNSGVAEPRWRTLKVEEMDKSQLVRVWDCRRFNTVGEAKAHLKRVEDWRADGTYHGIGVVYFPYTPEFAPRIFEGFFPW
ncbi:hypothetical protein B0A55_08138 [Friedmanniomyces simplex]|uniref:F-box domain-containing protein n=1 Tax=Friedmanniomyces simplex TaxID=329884 RepID=A0A4U0X1U4_9PEZI|nr:hypothetical protein B0A55_08138 [Friedmanniomyces simplex]